MDEDDLINKPVFINPQETNLDDYITEPAQDQKEEPEPYQKLDTTKNIDELISQSYSGLKKDVDKKYNIIDERREKQKQYDTQTNIDFNNYKNRRDETNITNTIWNDIQKSLNTIDKFSKDPNVPNKVEKSEYLKNEILPYKGILPPEIKNAVDEKVYKYMLKENMIKPTKTLKEKKFNEIDKIYRDGNYYPEVLLEDKGIDDIPKELNEEIDNVRNTIFLTNNFFKKHFPDDKTKWTSKQYDKYVENKLNKKIPLTDTEKKIGEFVKNSPKNILEGLYDKLGDLGIKPEWSNNKRIGDFLQNNLKNMDDIRTQVENYSFEIKDYAPPVEPGNIDQRMELFKNLDLFKKIKVSKNQPIFKSGIKPKINFRIGNIQIAEFKDIIEIHIPINLLKNKNLKLLSHYLTKLHCKIYMDDAPNKPIFIGDTDANNTNTNILIRKSLNPNKKINILYAKLSKSGGGLSIIHTSPKLHNYMYRKLNY